MVDQGKKLLEERFRPDGYYVGINVGPIAGQTVMRCHIHLIARRSGGERQSTQGRCSVIAGKGLCQSTKTDNTLEQLRIHSPMQADPEIFPSCFVYRSTGTIEPTLDLVTGFLDRVWMRTKGG